MKQKQNHKPVNKPGINPPVKKEINKGTPKPFFLDPYMKKYGLWITLGLVAMLILIIFFDFITGNKYYLFKDIGSDSINISWPHISLLVNYIKTEGFPMWSFAQGMGQNIQSSVSDPFSWFILFSGTKHLEYSFIVMELIKMLLAAIFFYLFLSELKLSNTSKIIGTLMYTFSGFIMIGSGWGIFSGEACLLALLLLGFEKLYQHNSWYLFPVPVAMILMLQPFDLYLYGLFLIFYFLLRHFTSDESSWVKLVTMSLKMAGLVILGMVISSFFLVPTVQIMMDSPRVSGNSSYANKLLSYPVFGTESIVHNSTAIMRFFANDLLGNGINFNGWYNYLEAPMVYIGLLPLLLFPQVFIFLNRKRKLIYGIFLALFFIPIIFPFFRYAFWAFTGDYYRGFSLFISLTLLLFSLFALNELDKVKRVNLPLLAATLTGLIVLLFYPYANIDQIIAKNLRSVALLFLLIYTGLIIFLSYSKSRNLPKVLIILFVFIEIGYFNSKSLNERQTLTRQETLQKAGYNDYSVDAIAYLNSNDKGFFRLNKDYSSGPAMHTSYNDAKIQGYYSTQSYTSFNQKYYIRFLEETGIIEKGKEFQSRWAPGLSTRPFFLTMASNKYLLTKQINSQFRQFGYDSIIQTGDVKILKNRNFLPLGFTYKKYIPLSQFQQLSVLQKQFVILKAFVAEEPVPPQFNQFTLFGIQDTSKNYTWEELLADLSALREDTLQISEFSNNRITGNIDIQEPRLLFFSIPYDKGWRCKVDGKETALQLCNVGFLGLKLETGKHDIELVYKPPYFKISLFASLAGVIIYLVLIAFQYWYDKRNLKLNV